MKFTYEVTACPLCHSTKSHYLTTGYTIVTYSMA